MGAEERGQGEAIAENLMEMMTLKVPVLSVFVGEGRSGGALALAVADEVWMLENAVYSVISPEGCASILWKDAAKVKEACSCLKITAEDLLEMGVIERIVPETSPEAICETLRAQLDMAFTELSAMTPEERCEKRYHRFRRLGVFGE